MTGPINERAAEPTVSASGALTLAHCLIHQYQADAAAIEAILGCELGILEDPDCRLPAQTHYRLWSFALRISNDGAIGLKTGEIIDSDRMGLIGHIVFNCDTLGHAIDQYLKLQRLVNETVRISRVNEGDWVRLVWEVEAPEYYCQTDMERTLAATVTRARHFIHPRLEIERLTLAHERPPWIGEYQRIFQCPLVFSAEQVSLRFARRYLDWRLPHRNPYVYSALLSHVHRVLARMSPRRQVTRKVRRLIALSLANGSVEADQVADQLHMSRQTLYRKLKHEGHGFQELVEDVRRERALRYVAANRYSLSEIAFLLGFSELSAFSRAFKRWTGEAPAKYRHRKK